MSRLGWLAVALISCGQPQMMTVPQTLTLNGSTTVFPIIDAAARQFMMANPSITITVTETDSGGGVKAAGMGTADIGMCSRDLKASEKTTFPDLQQITIAKDGIVIIAHPGNPASTVKMQQVTDVYTGNLTSWLDLGGIDAGIVVYQRETGSGTGDFFNQTFFPDGGVPGAVATHEQGNEGVKASVVGDVNGIGYVGFGFLDTTVQELKLISGGTTYTATTANILDGTYPVSRNLNLLTKGAPAGAAKTFIDFMLSTPGQAIVTQNGFVAIR